jgi:hypothetical protein
VRRDLVRLVKRSDRLGYSLRKDPSNYSGDRLADPESYLRFEFKVVIGRSSRMSAKERALMGRIHGRHSVEVVSYDRLLQLARARYSESSNPPSLFGVPVAR